MTDIEIKFSFRETLQDSYDEVKTVEITSRSDDSDEILRAFIEFCRSIGLELRMDYSIASSSSLN